MEVTQNADVASISETYMFSELCNHYYSKANCKQLYWFSLSLSSVYLSGQLHTEYTCYLENILCLLCACIRRNRGDKYSHKWVVLLFMDIHLQLN